MKQNKKKLTVLDATVTTLNLEPIINASTCWLKRAALSATTHVQITSDAIISTLVIDEIIVSEFDFLIFLIEKIFNW